MQKLLNTEFPFEIFKTKAAGGPDLVMWDEVMEVHHF